MDRDVTPKSLAFFGSDFDPDPDINGVRRKLLYFLAHPEREGIANRLCGGLARVLEQEVGCRLGGNYPCSDWLSSTPDFRKLEVYPELYRDFINNGGCLRYSHEFAGFVLSNVQEEEIPITIGVDHSLTGELVRALSAGKEHFKVVVLDSHLDAIEPSIRNALVGFMRESFPLDIWGQYEYYGEGFKGAYDAGSFLYWLMEEQPVTPANLIIIGNQDEPSPELRSISDKRVSLYVKNYDDLRLQGASVWSLISIRREGLPSTIADVYERLRGCDVYVSIDMDVIAGSLGRATRYGRGHGVEISEVLEVLRAINRSDGRLIGLDFMELDVNAIGLLGLDMQYLVEVVANMIRSLLGLSQRDGYHRQPSS